MKVRITLFILGLLFFATGPVVGEPHAFPVPFVEKDHARITFRDLPNTGTIKIFTITGDEIASLTIPQGLGLQHWNVKNASGKDLASGVYFFLVEGDSLKTTGKLVVIR